MTDKREAQRVHDIWAGELRQGAFLPRADQTRYEELVEDLKQHYRNTESRDLVEVNKRLKHLDAFFDGTRAAKIDALLIGRYIAQRNARGGSEAPCMQARADHRIAVPTLHRHARHQPHRGHTER